MASPRRRGQRLSSPTTEHTIRKIVIATGAVTTLAGTAGQYGNVDGTGAAARFQSPVGIASDGAGNLYVADSNNAIRKIVIATGVVTTLAVGTAAPRGTHRALRRRQRRGGQPLRRRYRQRHHPEGRHRDRRRHHPRGRAGQRGTTDGTGAAARFDGPSGIASDGAGNLYVADSDNDTIRKVVIATGAVTTLRGHARPAGQRRRHGHGRQLRRTHPASPATGRATSTSPTATTSTIRKVVIATGAVTTLAGVAGQAGSHVTERAPPRASDHPCGIASDGAGNLYVGDRNNNTIRKIVIATGGRHHARGRGAAARQRGRHRRGRPLQLAQAAPPPTGPATSTSPTRNTIRKIVIATGAVTTLAGTAGQSGSADGTGAAARFNAPIGIAGDGAGNLYVADAQHHPEDRHRDRESSPRWRAAGPYGNADGTGRGARFDSRRHRQRRRGQPLRRSMPAPPSGRSSPRPGTSPGSRAQRASSGARTAPAPPPASAAHPGIASDGAGNLYVADTSNGTIRKIVIATGAVTTLAGVAGRTRAARTASGAAARFNAPTDIASDGAGNLYVADGNTIRKIVIATGGRVDRRSGSPAKIGVSLGPLPASLKCPRSVAVLPTGELAIVDYVENAVLIARL